MASSARRRRRGVRAVALWSGRMGRSVPWPPYRPAPAARPRPCREAERRPRPPLPLPLLHPSAPARNMLGNLKWSHCTRAAGQEAAAVLLQRAAAGGRTRQCWHQWCSEPSCGRSCGRRRAMAATFKTTSSLRRGRSHGRSALDAELPVGNHCESKNRACEAREARQQGRQGAKGAGRCRCQRTSAARRAVRPPHHGRSTGSPRVATSSLRRPAGNSSRASSRAWRTRTAMGCPCPPLPSCHPNGRPRPQRDCACDRDNCPARPPAPRTQRPLFLPPPSAPRTNAPLCLRD